MFDFILMFLLLILVFVAILIFVALEAGRNGEAKDDGKEMY